MGEQKVDMNRLEEMFGQISERIQMMDNKVTSFVQEMKGLRLENEVLKETIEKQEKRITSLEREARRKNLIIKGVEDNEGEKYEETKEKAIKIIQSMGVEINPEIDIDNVGRMGRSREGVVRPIILKFNTTSKKMEIMKKTGVLKGTDIWVDEDYTKEIQEERKALIPKLNEARRKGHKAQLRYNKLIINNKVYDSKSIQEIEFGEETQSIDKKRKNSVRSPETANLEEQLRKITRTSKNGKQ